MMTGLIQTTSIAIYAFVWVPRTELAYAVWIMLLQSITQYPGFLGVFRGAMGALQQFNKVEVLNFISGELFQRLTEIGFVLLGRYWGMQNPQIGEIMGIAIGSVIGLYVDDFIATAMSAWYFSKVMKDKGISARRCFRIEFDWELAKEALVFGIKTGIPGIIGLASSLIQLRIWILFVPQYATFVTLFDFAGAISGLVNYGMSISLTQLFSESYMNGKPKLTEYYVTQYMRFATMVQFFFISIIAVIMMVIEPVFIGLGISNYMLAIPFIIPRVVREIQQPLTSLADTLLAGTNHPNFLMFIQIVEESLKVVLMWLWIVIMQLPMKHGFTAIIWLMPCGIYPAIILKTAANCVYIQKKIIKIRINVWQTIVAPTFACLGTWLIGTFFKIIMFDPLVETYGIIAGVASMIVLLVVLLVFAFQYIRFSGCTMIQWDPEKRAVRPVLEFIVYPMYKMIELSRVSPPITV